MKTSNVRIMPQCRQPHRRGAIFHYYMTYLLLTSMLMASSGLCIHAVLKADAVDSRIARNLQTLVRLEQQLRNDAQQSGLVACQPLQLTLHDPPQATRIVWTVEDNVVRRSAERSNQVENFDRFVFTRGTQLQFIHHQQQVLLSIQEERTQGTAVADKPDVLQSDIQIELWLPESPPAAQEVGS